MAAEWGLTESAVSQTPGKQLRAALEPHKHGHALSSFAQGVPVQQTGQSISCSWVCGLRYGRRSVPARAWSANSITSKPRPVSLV